MLKAGYPAGVDQVIVHSTNPYGTEVISCVLWDQISQQSQNLRGAIKTLEAFTIRFKCTFKYFE